MTLDTTELIGMVVGTPSGVTLAPEGGAHQSIGTPLIGMSQDGLAAFEEQMEWITARYCSLTRCSTGSTASIG